MTLDFIYPEQSAIPFQLFVFPDGQPHLKIDVEVLNDADQKQTILLRARITNCNDLFLVLLAKNILDQLGFECIELHIAYLMAARMDRVMAAGEPFSLQVVAAMINAAGFQKVCIFDPHSEVTTALIHHAHAVSNHKFVKDALRDYLQQHKPDDYCLVSPDAGARKKIYPLAEYLGISEVVECFKKRDPLTGALSGFSTTAENLSDKTCFIVDDLCDGGGTFAGTAALLRSKGAGRVVLIVSHGIFSKGTEIPGIDEFYCTDSFRFTPGVHCLAVDHYLQTPENSNRTNVQ